MDRIAIWLERLEIQEVLIRYAHALDTRQHDLLHQVFLEEADIDYRAAGGVRGNLSTWQAWLHPLMKSRFDSWQHLVSNFVIDVEGDNATALSRCYNPLQGRRDDGSNFVLHTGASYRDSLVRMPDGWRISQRILGVDWMDDAHMPG